MVSKDERQLNPVMSKLFKVNPYSSSEIHRQCDPLPDVSVLSDLNLVGCRIGDVARKYRGWLQDSVH